MSTQAVDKENTQNQQQQQNVEDLLQDPSLSRREKLELWRQLKGKTPRNDTTRRSLPANVSSISLPKPAAGITPHTMQKAQPSNALLHSVEKKRALLPSRRSRDLPRRSHEPTKMLSEGFAKQSNPPFPEQEAAAVGLATEVVCEAFEQSNQQRKTFTPQLDKAKHVLSMKSHQPGVGRPKLPPDAKKKSTYWLAKALKAETLQDYPLVVHIYETAARYCTAPEEAFALANGLGQFMLRMGARAPNSPLSNSSSPSSSPVHHLSSLGDSHENSHSAPHSPKESSFLQDAQQHALTNIAESCTSSPFIASCPNTTGHTSEGGSLPTSLQPFETQMNELAATLAQQASPIFHSPHCGPLPTEEKQNTEEGHEPTLAAGAVTPVPSTCWRKESPANCGLLPSYMTPSPNFRFLNQGARRIPIQEHMASPFYQAQQKEKPMFSPPHRLNLNLDPSFLEAGSPEASLPEAEQEHSSSQNDTSDEDIQQNTPFPSSTSTSQEGAPARKYLLSKSKQNASEEHNNNLGRYNTIVPVRRTGYVRHLAAKEATPARKLLADGQSHQCEATTLTLTPVRRSVRLSAQQQRVYPSSSYPSASPCVELLPNPALRP